MDSMSRRAQDRPIAIFDSGVGGLTVMRAVVDALPNEDILYLGDTARVPYGNRGPDTIRRYALNATRLLVERDVKALVVACNTATAHALATLIEHYDLPIIGVVEPVANAAASLSRTRHVGVIGTRATILSQCYPTHLARLDPGLTIHQTACPLLVPLAEEGWTNGDVVETIVHTYLAEILKTPIDALILGCTHYPLLTSAIARVVETHGHQSITLLDSAASTAQSLKENLRKASLLREDSRAATRRFLLTDIPDGFVPTAERFFGADIGSCEHVNITDLNASQ